jgi:hypothetical protein
MAAKPPVMDVRPPAAPHNDVAPAPVEELPQADDHEVEEPVEESKAEADQPKPAAVKTPKPPRQPGVTTAIVATLLIVLGLGLLATYAYLRSNGARLF